MREYLKFYIDGQWVDPVRPNTLDVDNPTTEQVSGKISIGSAADVDVAVQAARRAFASWSQTSREERLDVLQAILAEYQKRPGKGSDQVVRRSGRRHQRRSTGASGDPGARGRRTTGRAGAGAGRPAGR